MNFYWHVSWRVWMFGFGYHPRTAFGPWNATVCIGPLDFWWNG